MACPGTPARGLVSGQAWVLRGPFPGQSAWETCVMGPCKKRGGKAPPLIACQCVSPPSPLPGGGAFLRLRTASVNRYSICPLIERKSSSAQAARSFHREAEMRSKICFLSFSAKPSPALSKFCGVARLAKRQAISIKIACPMVPLAGEPSWASIHKRFL